MKIFKNVILFFVSLIIGLSVVSILNAQTMSTAATQCQLPQRILNDTSKLVWYTQYISGLGVQDYTKINANVPVSGTFSYCLGYTDSYSGNLTAYGKLTRAYTKFS